MSDDELQKAIIGTIGDIDAYQLPGGWGAGGAGGGGGLCGMEVGCVDAWVLL